MWVYLPNHHRGWRRQKVANYSRKTMDCLPDSIDVAILGGGSAGTATALKLKQQRPDLSVLIVERSNYTEARIGESLPPGTQTLLREIGAWGTFQKVEPRPIHGIESTWASSTVSTNDFFLHTAESGWIVDRRKFDQSLAHLARDMGAMLLTDSRVLPFSPDTRPSPVREYDCDPGWRVRFRYR